MTFETDAEPITRHFAERAATRALHPHVLAFILDFGTEFHAAGARHLTVIQARLPESVRGSRAAHAARDWIVVLGTDGVLLTCYRRKHASRFLRGKPKRRLSQRQLWSRKTGAPGLTQAFAV